MDDKVKAKYLLSGEAEKYLTTKHGFWYFENRMFGSIEGPYDDETRAFIDYMYSEERRKEIVRRVKDGTS